VQKSNRQFPFLRPTIIREKLGAVQNERRREGRENGGIEGPKGGLGGRGIRYPQKPSFDALILGHRRGQQKKILMVFLDKSPLQKLIIFGWKRGKMSTKKMKFVCEFI
jgi:hypothetical protein